MSPARLQTGINAFAPTATATTPSMTLAYTPTLSETDTFAVLGNQRRRLTLEHLATVDETVTLRDLAEAIATAESGEDPAPRNVRHAVYVSLHQTHLPLLDRLGVCSYDADRKHVAPLAPLRDVERFMGSASPLGVSWAEHYRALGVAGLFAVVAASAGVPVVSAVDPLAWGTLGLGAYAASTAYQLWTNRRSIARSLAAR